MNGLIFLALAALANATPYGIDVSSYQPNVDWTTVKSNGITFAYIKATEGTGKDFPSPGLESLMIECPCRLYFSFLQHSVHRRN